MAIDFFSCTRPKLAELLASQGLKPFVATQLFEWVYAKGVTDYAQMGNISKQAKESLKDTFVFDLPKPVNTQISKDGTVKFLTELSDGSRIETVFMPFHYGNSACVTTQVGCNMGCTFCASGLLKRERNLTAGEIVAQLVMVSEYLASKGMSRLSHYVVMGIGEPMDNFANLMDALDISKDAHGMAIGARHITVSTCGIVPKILEFGRQQPQVNLAISLHAPDDATRGRLMPINRAFPVQKLIATAREYVALTNRRITYEYILIDGVNDSVETARQLAELVQGKLCYVNLIPYNAVIENGFKRSSPENVRAFYETLVEHGIPCTVRLEKGADIDAACGQLRAKDRGCRSVRA